jgi:hypothetical protein
VFTCHSCSQSTTDVTEEEMKVPGERKEREIERGREAAREGERERKGERERIVVYAKHEHCCI